MRISFSAADQYAKCSLQYFFNRRRKIPVPEVGWAMPYGSVIHLSLENLHNSIKSPTELMLKSELIEEFVENWANEHMTNDMNITNAEMESSTKMGIQMLEAYYDKHYGTEWFNPPLDITIKGETQKGTELWFEVPLIDLSTGEVLLEDHVLIGKIDLINTFNSMILATDHKTAGRKYSDEQVANSNQLTFYIYVLKYLIAEGNIKNSDNLDVGACFSVLYKLKKPWVEVYPTSRVNADIRRLVAVLTAAIKGIESDIFVPADGNMPCSWCDYKEACRLWGTTDDWEEIYLKKIGKSHGEK